MDYCGFIWRIYYGLKEINISRDRKLPFCLLSSRSLVVNLASSVWNPQTKRSRLVLCTFALFGLVEAGTCGRHIGKRQYCLLCLG